MIIVWATLLPLDCQRSRLGFGNTCTACGASVQAEQARANGRNDDQRLTGYGEQEIFPDGWQQYAGFHGTAHIEGSRLRVILAGVDVHLEATGRGRAYLWGHGTRQQGDESGSWSTSGLGASVALSE